MRGADIFGTPTYRYLRMEDFDQIAIGSDVLDAVKVGDATLAVPPHDVVGRASIGTSAERIDQVPVRSDVRQAVKRNLAPFGVSSGDIVI